ncbi:MAG: AAA family ATPase [Candidatus Hodarchaeota archaeon]
MIIESVKVKNIRSIVNLDIKFPPSTLLFYGDIGSGKSSVLKAIEFGLFGTLTAADLGGDSLLRRGENRGSVELTFLIDSKRYKIKRNLKRIIKDKKSTVTQEEGSIIEYVGNEASETSYAPTDLRRKILSLLNYSITRYEKAQKIPIFRYTVYTPQEQVKEILLSKPEERFEILKEVFGIEKYEIGLKNLGVINEYLYNQLKKTQIFLDTIGEPEITIPKKEQEINQQKEIIKKIQQFLKEKEQEIERAELNGEKIQLELNEYSTKIVEINGYQKVTVESVVSKKENEDSLDILSKEIIKLEKEIKAIPQIKIKHDLKEDELEVAIKNYQKIQSEKEKDKAILEKKIEDLDNLLRMGKCSLCGQEIHEKERFDLELKEVNNKISGYSKEISDIASQILKYELSLKKLREFKNYKTNKEALMRLLEEKRKREIKLKEIINQLNQKIESNKKLIEIILNKYDIKDLEKLKELGTKLNFKLENQKNLIKKIKSEKIELEKELSAEQTSFVLLESELNKLKEDLKKKKVFRDRLEYLTDLRNWIVEKFQILIRDIEREIISSSARQFNEYFKEWFRTLVEEENIDVEIRFDDFEPIITVNGYDSPFNDLSGGEKSALSLAYRLALNKIINERYQEVKTKDLLILDEPTDGFSQEQINKMQEVFEKLNTSQMFIISHDRNLDSFVTDIFNFKKERHQTKVTKEQV